MAGDEVVRSLEILAARNIDPAPAVYAQVFSRWPDAEALFVRDGDGSVRGHMMFEVIEAILDVRNGGAWGSGLMRSERVNHENLGVSPDMFVGFFAALRDVVADSLGADWTPDMQRAWGGMLADLGALCA